MIDFFGLLLVFLLLLPNIVFASMCKDDFRNLYRNRVVETAEQIGRFGCFFLEFFRIPSLLFLESGILTRNFPLIAAALLFAPCHITISVKNALAKESSPEKK